MADLRVPDCLHLCFVRSSHAHAKIREIRLETALAMPGVVGAITGAELSKEIQGQKIPVLISAFAATYRQYWPLAVDEVYWHGEPLAAILAQDKYVAEDAAAAVEVDCEPLPVVTDAEAALRDGALRVYDDWDNNEIFGTSCTGGSEADEIAANDAEVEALFAKADVVLKQRFRTHRCGVCPIETRGALAIWSDADGLTVHLTTQRPSHRASRPCRSPSALDRRCSGRRTARSGRRLRRQGAVLPRACRGLSSRAHARSTGALDRDTRRTPDDGQPGARPDPRSRNRGGQGGPHPRAPQSRHCRRGRWAPGRLLGLRHALAGLGHAAERLRDRPRRHQAALRGHQQGLPEPVALVRCVADPLRARTRPRHAGAQTRARNGGH